MEAVTAPLFLGTRITVDSDSSDEIKSCLLLGRKTLRNLNSILKIRDITFLTKAHIVKVSGFSKNHVPMWESDHKEGWALKNRCFELWCWRRLLRMPRNARRWNWLILMEINPEYSSEGLMLKSSKTLATWCKELTHWKGPWCWERLKAIEKGAAEDDMVRQYHQLNEHEFEQTFENSERQGSLVYCSWWGYRETWLSDGTTIYWSENEYMNWGDKRSKGIVSVGYNLVLHNK